jgi:hypothetical protein
LVDEIGPDDESIDINLRSIDEIAARMVVLAAIIRRAMLELPLEEDETEDEFTADGERFDLIAALSTGVFPSITTQAEVIFVSTQVGNAGEESALSVSWQIEALAALAWATGLEQFLPEPWIQTDPGPLLASIPAPSESLSPFTSSLSLREEETIATERERAELWLWRCAIDEEIIDSQGSERKELLAELKDTVGEAVESCVLTEGTKDFVVSQRGFGSADAETKALIGEISTQRLQALNWLCGYGSSWDNVPLDI